MMSQRGLQLQVRVLVGALQCADITYSRPLLMLCAHLTENFSIIWYVYELYLLQAMCVLYEFVS